jgi:alanine racemase
MIDVTDTDADVGTRVTLFGDTPDQLAALSTYAKTIDYELLCAVSARVTREYRTTLLE